MQNQTKSDPGGAALNASAGAIFRQAASGGRDALNRAELGALLSSLAIGF